MTALAANTALRIRNRNGQTVQNGVVLTSSVMYHHAIAVRTAAGVIKPADNETTTRFFGLIEIDNPDDSTAGITGDGTLRVNAINDVEVLMVCVTAITVGDMGSAAYAADDATATTEATLGPEIGRFAEFVATNSAWVALGQKALVAAS